MLSQTIRLMRKSSVAPIRQPGKDLKDDFVNRELQKRGWRVLIAREHEFKTNKDIVGEKLDMMLGSSPGVSE